MKLSTMCYITKNNKTLMLYRNKKENDVHEGKYVGLGGKIEKGETPEECIVREVKEESGLNIKNPMLKGVLTFPSFKDDEDWYVFLYTARDFDGQITESNEGELLWVQNDDLEKLNLWDGDKLFLKWMKDDRFFSGKITYKKGKLEDYNVKFY